MKKRIWDVERLTAWEHSVRSDERGKVLTEFSKSQRECYEFASKIMQRTAAFRPPKENHDFVGGIERATPAPKRKAVTASAEDVGAALYVLCQTTPRYTPLSPKNVAAVWYEDGHPRQGAYKLAGAALKALVADGRATVKRGKYAQAQPPAQTADGATSEAP